MSESHEYNEAYLEGFRAAPDAACPYTDSQDAADWREGRADRAASDATGRGA